VSDIAISSTAGGAAEDPLLATFVLTSSSSPATWLLGVNLPSGDVVLNTTISTGGGGTVRMDGAYLGVALPGAQNGTTPTALVYYLGSGSVDSNNVPLLSYGTPGSMHAVDIVVEAAAGAGSRASGRSKSGGASSVTPSQTANTGGADTVYFAVAGKAVQDHTWGNGGNAYGWKIST
jgi:hypothetical protein